jgi:hypothetical protein
MPDAVDEYLLWAISDRARAAAAVTAWAAGRLTDGAEIEALAGSSPSFAAWEQNEPYTIALLIKGRSGGTSTKHLYRSGTSRTGESFRATAFAEDARYRQAVRNPCSECHGLRPG